MSAPQSKPRSTFQKLKTRLSRAAPDRRARQSVGDSATTTGTATLADRQFTPDLDSDAIRKQGSLCAACTHAMIAILNTNKRHNIHTLHASVDELYDGASRRCPVCLLLVERFLKDKGYEPTFCPISINLSILIDTDVRAATAKFARLDISTECEHTMTDLEGDWSDGTADECKPSNFRVGWNIALLNRLGVPLSNGLEATSTGSDACLAQVEQWLHNCDADHPRCKGVSSSYCPTRLLDVGQSVDDAVRLVVTSGHIKTVKRSYITLSHCWGDAMPLKLKEATIVEFQYGLPVTRFPPTFREAIDVARRLKIQFLWIDSLCIVQDSTEDWQNESVKMQDVYRHARLNLASCVSVNVLGGLFRERTASDKRYCTFQVALNNDLPQTWVIFVGDELNLLNQSTLNKRAWVLQERVLANRTVHFGKDQIHWECQELDANETWPHGYPPLPPDVTGYNLGIRIVERIKLGCDENGAFYCDTKDPTGAALNTWSDLVETYMRGSLTKEDDKLIAIGGLAKAMSIYLKADYLAGLWSVRLVSQLMWRRIDGGMNVGQYPSRYRAPSWSWAASDGELAIPSNSTEPFKVTVQHASVVPVASDPMGQVKSGSIRLQGDLFPAKSGSPGVWFRKFSLTSVNLPRHSRSIRVHFDVPDSICFDVEIEVQCLPVQTTLCRSYSDSLEVDGVEGLVLARAKEYGNGVYRRLGTFSGGGGVNAFMRQDLLAGEGSPWNDCRDSDVSSYFTSRRAFAKFKLRTIIIIQQWQKFKEKTRHLYLDDEPGSLVLI